MYGTLGYEALKEAEKIHSKVLMEEENKETVISVLLSVGTNFILTGSEMGFGMAVAAECATTILLLEERSFANLHDVLDGDNRAVVSFYRKRLPCQCLDKTWKILKGKPKIGHCHNCNVQAERGALLLCGRCRFEHYCSADCQKAAWPRHKSSCKRLEQLSESEKVDEYFAPKSMKLSRAGFSPVLRGGMLAHLKMFC
ncbi:hypothetical protein ACHAWF_005603 [Thalassiosira exigua]